MPSLSDLVQRTGTDLLVDLLTFLPQDQRALAAQACAFLLDPSRETSEVRPFALNGSVLLDAFLVLLLTRSRKRDLTWQSSVATTAGAGSGTGAPATTIPASEVVVPERPRESAPKDEASSDPDLVSEHKQFAVDKQAEEPKKHDRQEAPVVRLISKPSGLANLLRELLVFAPGSGEQPISVLVRRDTIVYKLASFLTLRQLKAFFRRHHAGISETPRQIALEFLDDLFHPIWKLRGDEPELFDMLCRTAAALMRVSVPEGGSSSPQHAPAHVDVTFLDFFGARLVTVLEAATTLTKDDLKKVWPRKTRERRLLVTLLAAARDESRSGTGASLPSYQPLSPPSPGEEGAFGDEMSGLAPPPRPAVPTARLQDLEGQFRDWVQRAVNVPLSSQTLDGMLSEFQDMASDRNLPLTRRHGLVTSYMETFWQQHKRFLSKNAAISLANLGVVIDDARGAEHWADALFTQARRLEPEHERIRLNHAEFLLDVAKDQGRLHTLIQQGENKYANAAAVFAVIESILQFRGGGESNFRRELDLLRLDDLRKGPSDNLTAKNERLFPQASKLVITHAEFLLSAARTRSFSPFFRFSNSLDEIYGGRSVSGIQPASQVLAVAWRFFELALGTRGSWPAAVWIANRYVGQSDTQSEEERIGLGMNRWLLNQPDFVNAEPRQVSLVWSQTGAAISRLGYPNILRRIALSFAAALEMDPDGLPELAVRVAAAWKFLKKDIRPGLDALRETLVSELDSPARSLLKNGVRAESNLAALTDYVFGTEILPVGSVAELARRDNWKDEMLTAIETTAVACVEEAGIHRPGMEPS